MGVARLHVPRVPAGPLNLLHGGTEKPLEDVPLRNAGNIPLRIALKFSSTLRPLFRLSGHPGHGSEPRSSGEGELFSSRLSPRCPGLSHDPRPARRPQLRAEGTGNGCEDRGGGRKPPALQQEVPLLGGGRESRRHGRAKTAAPERFFQLGTAPVLHPPPEPGLPSANGRGVCLLDTRD